MPDEISEYYQRGLEQERLRNPWGELERVRTLAIIEGHLPAPPATILDVGGAAGAYAFALAERGYRVHLVDPVELHLEQARAREKASGMRLASITQGDARRLEFAAGSADAALLLGPLYHLTEREDRLRALAEARRVLRPGGVVFAAGISRFASLMDGLGRGFFADAEFRAIVEGDLRDGRHRNPTQRAEYFTTAYFHRPQELAEELMEAGFAGAKVLGIEGPVWSASGFRAAWEDRAQREKLLEFLAAVENEGSVVGASAHLMGIGSVQD